MFYALAQFLVTTPTDGPSPGGIQTTHPNLGSLVEMTFFRVARKGPRLIRMSPVGLRTFNIRFLGFGAHSGTVCLSLRL